MINPEAREYIRKNEISTLCNLIDQAFAATKYQIRVKSGQITPQAITFELQISGIKPATFISLQNQILSYLSGYLNLPESQIQIGCNTYTHEYFISLPQFHASVDYLGFLETIKDLPRPFEAPLGINELGAPVYLRIPKHPKDPKHARTLIAGISGSGKTELAKTLLLSMSLTTSPKDLAIYIANPDPNPNHSLSPLLYLPHVVHSHPPGIDTVKRQIDACFDFSQFGPQPDKRQLLAVFENFDEIYNQLFYRDRERLEKLVSMIRTPNRLGNLHLVIITQLHCTWVREFKGSDFARLFAQRFIGQAGDQGNALRATGISYSHAEQLLGTGDFIHISGFQPVHFQSAYLSPLATHQLVPMIRQTHTQPSLPSRV